MYKPNPITNLTPAACEQVLALMMVACTKIAADHGLNIEGTWWRPRADGLAFETGFSVSVPGREAKERKREKEIFAALAGECGLKATDFEREFAIEGERYRLTGIDPRRFKYPINADRVSDGRAVKLPLEQVVKLLGGELKS
jgi:hypothetical protein